MARKKKIKPEVKRKLELMSFGRRITYLKRCIAMKMLIEEHESATTIRCRVFDIYIQPIMCCSYVTFNNMLNEPNPEKQIVEITKKMTELKNSPVEKVNKIHSIPQGIQNSDRVVPVDGGW